MNNYSKTKKITRKILRNFAKLLTFLILVSFGLAIVSCLAFVLGVFTTVHSEPQNPNFTSGELEVIMLDVGQGDSFLFLQNDHAMLVDTGTIYNCSMVKDYLNQAKVRKLDYLVVTHPHQDHASGIFAILSSIKVDKFLDPAMKNEGWDFNDSLFLKLYNVTIKTSKLMYGKNWMVSPKDLNYKFAFGDVNIDILSPQKDDYTIFNDYSLVMKMTYGEISMLFTGDAEKDVEKELAESGINLHVDVYKAAHHGSKTSNRRSYLDEVNPKYVLISSDNGNDNLYGHPVKDFMNYLKEKEIKVYRTDESGTVVLKTDGKTISFDTDPDDYLSGKELLSEKKRKKE